MQGPVLQASRPTLHGSITIFSKTQTVIWVMTRMTATTGMSKFGVGKGRRRGMDMITGHAGTADVCPHTSEHPVYTRDNDHAFYYYSKNKHCNLQVPQLVRLCNAEAWTTQLTTTLH
jgi:hypothetical protein